MENIKDIFGFEGIYKINDNGDIYAYPKIINGANGGSRYHEERKLKYDKVWSGYLMVTLYKNKIKSRIPVHRIVAQSFIPNPENKPEVNHKNGIKTDNRAENLEWVTKSENQKHSYKIGLIKPTALGKFGSNHMASKTIIQIDLSGELIKKWGSTKEAADYFDVHPSAISNAIRKKTTSAGYKWDLNIDNK